MDINEHLLEALVQDFVDDAKRGRVPLQLEASTDAILSACGYAPSRRARVSLRLAAVAARDRVPMEVRSTGAVAVD